MKNSMKRLLCTLLATCLLCGLVVTASVAGAETASYSTCGNGLTWQFDEETGVLTIQGSGPMYNFEDEMNLPWSQYLTQIKKVVVIYGVTSIGKNAFAGCTALTEVKLPSSIRSVDSAALHGAENLQKVFCIGEETQVKQIMKDVDLNGAELIIIPIWTAEPGTAAPIPTVPDPTDPDPTDPDPIDPDPTDPDPTDPDPTDPDPTDPAPTDPDPTDPDPTEPVERTTVRYERNMRITETWLGGQLILRRDEPLDYEVGTGASNISYIEYTDFNAQNKPQKATTYGMDSSDYVYLFEPKVTVTEITTMEYDDNGVLISETCAKPTGEKVYESVISNGVKVQDVYTDNSVYSYEYDEDGRLAKQTYNDGASHSETTQYQYNESGELITISKDESNGWKTIVTFEQGQMTSFDSKGESGHSAGSYERNENGQIVKKNWMDSFAGLESYESEERYQYDENGALVEKNYVDKNQNDPTGRDLTTKYEKGENGEVIQKTIDETYGAHEIKVLSADGTTAYNVRYSEDGQISGIEYAKKDTNDKGEGSYVYSYIYDRRNETWREVGYQGTGSFSSSSKGAAPTADDPLLQYVLTIDPQNLMVMLAELEEAGYEISAPEVGVPMATEPAVTEPVTEPVSEPIMQPTMHEHTWDTGTVVLAPTCTCNGEMGYICTGCGAFTSEFIPALDHVFDQVTCLDSGEYYYSCVCGVLGSKIFMEPGIKKGELVTEPTAEPEETEFRHGCFGEIVAEPWM